MGLEDLSQRRPTRRRAGVERDGEGEIAEPWAVGQPRDGADQRLHDQEVGDVADWVLEVVSQMAVDQTSMVLDMGGDDRVLEELAKQMNLSEFCESSGIAPLAIYTLGPDKQDFKDTITVYEKGYARCERSLFVMNESLVASFRRAYAAGSFLRNGLIEVKRKLICEVISPAQMEEIA